MSERQWQGPRTNYAGQRQLVEELGISPPVAQVLVNRGVTSVEAARVFLEGSLADLPDPWILPGMADALEEIDQALANGEKILVYGDYDADGITATVLMVELLKAHGAAVDCYLPDRFTEGYGLHKDALHYAAGAGFRAVVTVDCGITALEEARAARDWGLRLIITDHHQRLDRLPEARAVVYPREGQELAGVGVALAVARALDPARVEDYLDLAALGTLADVVPLAGENRLLVRLGLPLLQRPRRPGLLALLEVAGLREGEISLRDITYQLIPRLNAAGRLGKAQVAVELLSTSASQQAWELARSLDAANQQRQLIEKAMLAEATAMIEETGAGSEGGILVLSAGGWHEGLVGLVASRLAREYGRPAVLIAERQGRSKGSGRSIYGVNLYETLATCRDLLIDLGGHPQAVGLEIAPENIGALRERLIHWWSTRPPAAPRTPAVDATVLPQQVGPSLLEEVERLAPFGAGNPEPVFYLPGVELQQVRRVGEGGSHLKAALAGGQGPVSVVGFGQGETASLLSPGKKSDVVFRLVRDDWNGGRQPELILEDIRVPAASPFPGGARPGVFTTGQVVDASRGEEMFLVWREVLARLAQGERVVVCSPSRRRALLRMAASRYLDGSDPRPAYLVDGSWPQRQARAILKEFRRTGGLLVATTAFWEQFADEIGEVNLLVKDRPDGKAGAMMPAFDELAITRDPEIRGAEWPAPLRELAGGSNSTVIICRAPKQAERLAAWLRNVLPRRASRVLALHEGQPLVQQEGAVGLFREGIATTLATTPLASEVIPRQAEQVIWLISPFSVQDFCRELAAGTPAAALYPWWPVAEHRRQWDYLDRICPGLDKMRHFYRTWHQAWQQGERQFSLPSYTARAAWSIFEELGLLPGHVKPTVKVDLRQSWRYREAEKEREDLQAWEELAAGWPAANIRFL